MAIVRSHLWIASTDLGRTFPQKDPRGMLRFSEMRMLLCLFDLAIYRFVSFQHSDGCSREIAKVYRTIQRPNRTIIRQSGVPRA